MEKLHDTVYHRGKGSENRNLSREAEGPTGDKVGKHHRRQDPSRRQSDPPKGGRNLAGAIYQRKKVSN